MWDITSQGWRGKYKNGCFTHLLCPYTWGNSWVNCLVNYLSSDENRRAYAIVTVARTWQIFIFNEHKQLFLRDLNVIHFWTPSMKQPREMPKFELLWKRRRSWQYSGRNHTIPKFLTFFPFWGHTVGAHSTRKNKPLKEMKTIRLTWKFKESYDLKRRPVFKPLQFKNSRHIGLEKN